VTRQDTKLLERGPGGSRSTNLDTWNFALEMSQSGSAKPTDNINSVVRDRPDSLGLLSPHARQILREDVAPPTVGAAEMGAPSSLPAVTVVSSRSA
jgi:hypothetical protein